MFRLACIAVAAAVLLSPDVEQALGQQQGQSQPQSQIPTNQNVPALPKFDAPSGQGSVSSSTSPASSTSAAGSGANSASSSSAQPDAPALPPPPAPDAPALKEDTRLELIRFVSGEFARAVITLPGGKAGYHLKAGEPVDQAALRYAVIRGGAALNPGDNAQITKLDFREREIVVDVNGGGDGRTPWRQRVQVQTASPVMVGPPTGGNNGPPKKAGATVFLEFDRPLPEMTPDQLKGYLSAVLDFSKERSAAVQWTQSLPPKIQEAITEKRAELGMDRDEVLAAMGRPDRKVRDQDDDGNETEDWIYGDPPNVTFVRFQGDKVIKVDQYPNSQSP